MTALIHANVGGLKVVEKPGMMRNAWLLKDADGNVLRSGVVGMGELKTPGADQTKADTIECGSDLYAMLRDKLPKETS